MRTVLLWDNPTENGGKYTVLQEINEIMFVKSELQKWKKDIILERTTLIGSWIYYPLCWMLQGKWYGLGAISISSNQISTLFRVLDPSPLAVCIMYLFDWPQPPSQLIIVWNDPLNVNILGVLRVDHVLWWEEIVTMMTSVREISCVETTIAGECFLMQTPMQIAALLAKVDTACPHENSTVALYVAAGYYTIFRCISISRSSHVRGGHLNFYHFRFLLSFYSLNHFY